MEESNMGFIRSFPGLIKVFNTLRVFNHYEKDIKAAREAGDYELERKIIADSSFQWATRVTEVLPIEVEVHGGKPSAAPSPGQVLYPAGSTGP